MTNFCHLGGVVCVYNILQGTVCSVVALDWTGQLSLVFTNVSKNRPRESEFFCGIIYLVNPLFLIAEDSTWSTEIDSFVITQDCGFFSQDN